MKILIKIKNLDNSSEMKEFINNKFSNLNKYHSEVTEIRVELERDAHHLKGKIIRCEANVILNGNLIRVEKKSNNVEKTVNKVKDHLKVILANDRKKEIDKKRR
jgi:ribosomal subunit interface protein